MLATALAPHPTRLSPTGPRPCRGSRRSATVIAGPWPAATGTATATSTAGRSVRWSTSSPTPAPVALVAPVVPARHTTPMSARRPAGASAATYRRRRLLALGLALVAAAGVWLVLHAVAGALGGGGAPSLQPVAARTWVVQPGDTAWGIALASGAKGDIRPVVDAIEAQTGGHPLFPGERLTLP